MDPVSTAIIAGLTAGVAGGATEAGKKLIVDAYEAVKAALKQKFGDDNEVVTAVERLEQKPDSEARKAGVQEEVQAAGADKDPDILAKAEALLEKLKEQPGGQVMVQQIASGSYIAQASHGGQASVRVNQSKE